MIKSVILLSLVLAMMETIDLKKYLFSCYPLVADSTQPRIDIAATNRSEVIHVCESENQSQGQLSLILLLSSFNRVFSHQPRVFGFHLRAPGP